MALLTLNLVRRGHSWEVNDRQTHPERIVLVPGEFEPENGKILTVREGAVGMGCV